MQQNRTNESMRFPIFPRKPVQCLYSRGRLLRQHLAWPNYDHFNLDNLQSTLEKFLSVFGGYINTHEHPS